MALWFACFTFVWGWAWFPPLFLEEEPECGLEQYLMTQLIISGMFHYLVRKNDDILGSAHLSLLSCLTGKNTPKG